MSVSRQLSAPCRVVIPSRPVAITHRVSTSQPPNQGNRSQLTQPKDDDIRTHNRRLAILPSTIIVSIHAHSPSRKTGWVSNVQTNGEELRDATQHHQNRHHQVHNATKPANNTPSVSTHHPLASFTQSPRPQTPPPHSARPGPIQPHRARARALVSLAARAMPQKGGTWATGPPTTPAVSPARGGGVRSFVASCARARSAQNIPSPSVRHPRTLH